MKRIICSLCLLVFAIMFSSVLLNAQSAVFAGFNKYVALGSQVQLNAVSVDEGVWDSIPGIAGYNMLDICYANDTTLFAGATNGNILKSTNGGRTWTAKAIDSGSSFGSIAFYDHLNGVAATYTSAIYRTEDGGDTWERTFKGGNFKFSRIKYISKTTILASDNANFYKSYDGGKSWTIEEGISTTKGFNDFIINPEGDIFALFTNGKIAAVKNYKIDSLNINIGFPPLKSGVFINYYQAVVIGNSGIGIISYDPLMGQVAGYYGLPIDSIYEEIKQPNGAIRKVNGVKFSSLTLKSIRFVTDSIGYVTATLSGNSYILKTKDAGFNWKIDRKFSNTTVAECDVCNSKVIVCGNGLIARYVTEDAENDTYSWSPAAGLSNSQIKNPVATIDQPTEFTVTRTHNNIVSTSKVIIDIESLIIVSVGDNAIGCTGSVPLEYARTNYSGTAPMTYKWSPATGLSADNIPNPVFTDSPDVFYEMEVAKYNLTVSVQNGESVSKEVTVTRNPLKINAGLGKTFICGMSSQGNRLGPVYTNYTGTQPLKYRWFAGSQVLANEPDPIVPVPAKTTVYTLEVSTQEGCFQKTTVTVNVTQPSANVGADKSVSCGDSVLIDQPYSNLSTTGKLSYKWTPAEGLSSDTIVRPIAKPLVSTTYTLTVTSSAGCSASDALVVSVIPLTVNAGEDKTTSCLTPLQLGPVSSSYAGAGVLKYKWTPATGLSNDSIANPTVAVSTTTEYTLTITNENGCTASDKAKIIISTPDKHKIDYVGVTSMNRNIINWTRLNNPNVSAYRIYRETNVANNYSKIADLTDVSSVSFVDTLSFPDVQSNSYKLSVVDACGSESPLSDGHKTMHLSINQGVNSTWNLIWEQYQGFPVSTYNIFRGVNRTEIRQIGSLSGNNSQFTDFTAPAGSVYYQIEAVGAVQSGAPAYGKMLAKNSEDAVNFTSRSNIATNYKDVDGIFELKDLSSSLSVYPNPATDRFKIILQTAVTEETVLKIYDVTGSLVHSEPVLSNTQEIKLQQPNGIYFIFVESGDAIAKQKLVLNK